MIGNFGKRPFAVGTSAWRQASVRSIGTARGKATRGARFYPSVTFFFDGTGNNMYQEQTKPASEQRLSNVAKLFNAAVVNKQRASATPRYIPGVGTPFRIPKRVPGYTDFPDDHGGAAGLGLGAGGDIRINFAIGEFARILEQEWGMDTLRHIQHLSLSVFGFSRGATLARAFVRRFIQTRCERTDDGLMWIAADASRIPLRIPFMGIFDTVASVGGPSLHLDWAAELAIPPEVQRCVHFVAAHEVRQAFPLDSVRVGQSYPANCEEVVYPGVHSDVGGGYAPGDQGRSHLLSRIPLRHMYVEALRAGVRLQLPVDLQEERRDHYALPEDDPVTALYQSYMSALPDGGGDLESLIQSHRRLKFHWHGTIARRGEDERVLGHLHTQVSPALCRAVPAATDLDHVACPPNQWSYAIPPNPEKQVQQLLGEHRRLAQHVAFLRNPIEAVDSARAWPPPSPRKRTPYEDLILSAWDNPAPVPPAVDTLLAEHVTIPWRISRHGRARCMTGAASIAIRRSSTPTPTLAMPA
jgi:hypothetical protein